MCFWMAVGDSCVRDVAGEASSCRPHCPETKCMTDHDITLPHTDAHHTVAVFSHVTRWLLLLYVVLRLI